MAFSGCGGPTSTGPVCYPANGSVIVDGKPAFGAHVVLHPVDASVVLRPGAETDDDGNFVLTTRIVGDGGPAGEYKVAIRWDEEHVPVSSAAASPNGPILSMSGNSESKDEPRDRLNGKYSNPDTSGLKCKIEAVGANEIPTFNLTLK